MIILEIPKKRESENASFAKIKSLIHELDEIIDSLEDVHAQHENVAKQSL